MKDRIVMGSSSKSKLLEKDDSEDDDSESNELDEFDDNNESD